MAPLSEPDNADYQAVADLYDGWSQRSISGQPPLSPTERIGFLVVTFGVRHDMVSWDSFEGELLETVDALRAVDLGKWADLLQSASEAGSWAAQIKALQAIHLDENEFEFLHVAVARLLRRRAS